MAAENYRYHQWTTSNDSVPRHHGSKMSWFWRWMNIRLSAINQLFGVQQGTRLLTFDVDCGPIGPHAAAAFPVALLSRVSPCLLSRGIRSETWMVTDMWIILWALFFQDSRMGDMAEFGGVPVVSPSAGSNLGIRTSRLCYQDTSKIYLSLREVGCSPGLWSHDGPICTYTLQTSASVFWRNSVLCWLRIFGISRKRYPLVMSK